MVKRKYPAIDLIRLTMSEGHVEWRTVLKKCERDSDLERLRALIYGLGAGMDLAVKNKLSSPKLEEIYAMLVRSVEVVAKRIFRKRFPMMADDPNFLRNVDTSKYDPNKEIRMKRQRDAAFLKFLNEARF